MNSIYEHLISALKEHSFSILLHVYEAYSVQTPTYPAIVVDEVINREKVSVGRQERVTQLAYRFEIHCRDEWDEAAQAPISRRQVAQRLGSEVDQMVRETLGLTRTGDPAYLPAADQTVGRYVLTYQCYLSDDYIYQEGV